MPRILTRGRARARVRGLAQASFALLSTGDWQASPHDPSAAPHQSTAEEAAAAAAAAAGGVGRTGFDNKLCPIGTPAKASPCSSE